MYFHLSNGVSTMLLVQTLIHGDSDVWKESQTLAVHESYVFLSLLKNYFVN